MLYNCTKFYLSISYGFRVTDLNSRVNARVVANVNGQTYGRTNGRKTGSPYLAMPEAGATMINGWISVCVNVSEKPELHHNLSLHWPQEEYAGDL